MSHFVGKTLLNLQGKPCAEPVCTVAEYVARHPVLIRVPNKGYRLVGETLRRTFPAITEAGMDLISSLNIALRDFHVAGFCVSDFDESNLVVSKSTHELLFEPIRSKEMKPPLDLPLPPGAFATPGRLVHTDIGKIKFKDVEFQHSTPEGIQANYNNAHAFVIKNLFHPEIPIPDDVEHLLKLMNSPESAIMSPLISKHPSLVYWGLRRCLVMTYIPYIRHKLPDYDPTAEATILGELPYLNDWVERAKNNKLLELFFNKRQHNYRADAGGLLDFYFDVSINRMEWSRSLGGYTPDEVEMVNAVTYPELLPKIQEALWKKNHLKKAHMA